MVIAVGLGMKDAGGRIRKIDVCFVLDTKI